MGKFKKKWIAALLCWGLISFYFSEPQNTEVTFRDLDVTEIQSAPLSELSSEDFKREMGILLFALESTYAGKLAYPEEFNDLVANLRKLDSAYPNGISSKEFAIKLNEIFKKFPDGHLNVTSDVGGYEIITKRYLASSSEASECEAKVEYLADNSGRNTLLLRAPSFLVDQNTRDLFESFSEKIDSADKFVIDLRGNTGGYVDIPLKVAARLWGESYRDGNKIQYFPSPLKNTYSLNNNSAYQMRENFYYLSYPEKLKKQREVNRNIFTRMLNYNEYAEGSLRKKLFAPSDFASHIDQDINVYEDEPENLKEKGFTKPIIIIVDKSCASACESFLESLETHPHVTIIGEKTAGAVQFGSIGLVQLPKSQITVSIATAYADYKDKRRIERVGYSPDIIIESDKDPISKALSL